MHTVIHTSHRPLSTQISPTRHITTLINQVCRIGLILINVCPSFNIMNKTGTITTTLHRVNDDTTPSSHIVNHHSNIQPIIFQSWSTNRRKIWGYEKYRSHDWVSRTKAKNGLTVPTKLPNPRSHKTSKSKILTLFFKSYNKKNLWTHIGVWKTWFSSKIIFFNLSIG